MSERPDYSTELVVAVVRTIARYDTWDDMKIIPISLLKNTIEHSRNVQVKQLDSLIYIDLTVKGRNISEVFMNREIGTKIEIKLLGSLFPVLLRNIRIYETMQEMEIVLLRIDLLDKLRFNFKQNMTERYSQVNILDCSQKDRLQLKSRTD